MILILGKNGYVSKRFQKFFDYKGVEYITFSFRNTSQRQECMDYINNNRGKIKLIINCIGYTGVPNVDACEDNKEECLYVNSVFAEQLADYAKFSHIPFAHISSGCIYNNISNVLETYIPNFSFYNNNECSWYSGTKALGESLIRKTYDKHYIWRVRMPFNHIDDGKNYISKIIKYHKVWSSPNSLTNVDEFVQSCYNMYIQGAPYGTYNVTNPDGISAKEILEIAKEYGITKEKYEYYETLEEFTKEIRAPRSNCVLNTDKLDSTGCGLLPVEESLRKTFESWNKQENIIFW